METNVRLRGLAGGILTCFIHAFFIQTQVIQTKGIQIKPVQIKPIAPEADLSFSDQL